MLKASGIELVIDVRRWPTSKTEDFVKENMEKWLKEAGIGYVWMGEKLGGYRKGGFERYMKSREFKEGVEELLKLARERKTCILCLEENPRRCHRRFISNSLEHLGVRISHILR